MRSGWIRSKQLCRCDLRQTRIGSKSYEGEEGSLTRSGVLVELVEPSVDLRLAGNRYL